jgi:XTP/dITP diphosphohydrolase
VKVLFATGNAGKLAELRGLVGSALDVISLRELSEPIPEPVEDGATFEANAVKKALHYAKGSALPTLADDSGLCVDALDGAPGVLSARYAPGNDAARVQKLLHTLADVPAGRRSAAFQCALCLALPSGEHVVEQGACRGEIAFAPKGEHGFGYDPVFFVPERNRTMAELTREEKAELSHRGQAFSKMLPRLKGLVAGGPWR